MKTYLSHIELVHVVVLTEPTQDNAIQEIQTRIWASLKSGYKYSGTADDSEKYLRPLVGKRLDLTIMYVDLVGSTSMSLEISQTKFITIISSFVHEMAHAVKRHNGYVLKFVGDAVLAYFPNDVDAVKGTYDSLECAFSMINTIKHGMNPILNQYDYPDLKIKIGIDSGQIMAISYGVEKDDYPIDLIGPPMNIASKIQSLAKPNQILVGEDVYKKVHPDIQPKFQAKVFSNSEWKYRSRVTGNVYGVYGYHPSK